MKKPVVHYKGNPSFSSGFAFLVAIDHPRFPANFPVRTSQSCAAGRQARPNERRVMPRRKQQRNDMDHLIDDSDRLKPCPFCGAEAEIITLKGETDEPSIGAQCVQCTSSACGAASGLIYPLMDDVTDLLRERWNKRHN